MSRFRKGDPTQLHKRLGTISDTLEDFSPRPMSAGTRDVLVREEKRLIGEIKPLLTTNSDLRRNPPGTVGKILRGEMSSGFKKLVLKWRNLRKQIYQDDTDPELCSLEQHRPTGVRWDGTSSFMPGAQIPGFHAMTPAAKENWPEDLGQDVNSAAAQAERASRKPQAKADGGKEGAGVPERRPRKKYKSSPEVKEGQRARAAQMNESRKAKREAEQASYGGSQAQ